MKGRALLFSAFKAELRTTPWAAGAKAETDPARRAAAATAKDFIFFVDLGVLNKGDDEKRGAVRAKLPKQKQQICVTKDRDFLFNLRKRLFQSSNPL